MRGKEKEEDWCEWGRVSGIKEERGACERDKGEIERGGRACESTPCVLKKKSVSGTHIIL